jgi:hypothetical protein
MEARAELGLSIQSILAGPVSPESLAICVDLVISGDCGSLTTKNLFCLDAIWMTWMRVGLGHCVVLGNGLDHRESSLSSDRMIR